MEGKPRSYKTLSLFKLQLVISISTSNLRLKIAHANECAENLDISNFIMVILPFSKKNIFRFGTIF